MLIPYNCLLMDKFRTLSIEINMILQIDNISVGKV